MSNRPVSQTGPLPILAAAQAAVSGNGSGHPNGNGKRRPSAAARIEAALMQVREASAAAAAAIAAGEASADSLRSLYENRLVAALDAEDLGRGLTGDDLRAVLHLVRRLDGVPSLPARDPGAALGSGSGPQAMLP